jgi:hypothetical protein
MTFVTTALVVARRLHPVVPGGIRPDVREMTVGHRLHHPVPVGTRRDVGATTVGRPLHLVLVEPMIDVTTTAGVMVGVAMSPPRGIVAALSRLRGLHPVVAMTTNAHVRHRVETTPGTVPVTTTAEEMTHGRDIGIAGADAKIVPWDTYVFVSGLCHFLIFPRSSPKNIALPSSTL